ncbi:MAG: hypothetical protein AAGF79_11305 [Pseudomonadota bacterium]
MFLVLSIALFAIFAVNVGIGSAGNTPVLGDVGEMLLLFAAVLVFVVAILKRETAEKKKAEQNE